MRFAIVSVVATLALAGCNTSNNYFQAERSSAETDRDTSMFGTMLTMTGMVPPPRENIDYSPRAPIAMPSNSELPTPGADNGVEAAVNFPEDQDAAERRRRREIRDTLAGNNYVDDAVRNNPQTLLSNETIQAGRREGGGREFRGPELRANPFGDRTANVTRQELKQQVRVKQPGGDILNVNGEASERRYLIQPPTTYRTPADTAPLPDKKDIENSDWAQKRLYNIKDKTPRRLQD